MKTQSKPSDDKPSDRPGILVVLAVAGYLIMVTVIMVFLFAHLWPSPESTGPYGKKLLWAFRLCDETRLLLLVIFAGAIGSQINMLKCFAGNVGHGQLKRSWIVSYIFGPLVGASLAAVFYLVIRAWFCPSQEMPAGVFGFTSMAAIVGIFADPIAAKLKALGEALLKAS